MLDKDKLRNDIRETIDYWVEESLRKDENLSRYDVINELKKEMFSDYKENFSEEELNLTLSVMDEMLSE